MFISILLITLAGIIVASIYSAKVIVKDINKLKGLWLVFAWIAFIAVIGIITIVAVIAELLFILLCAL